MPVTHLFVSAKSDGPDTTVVQPSDWNQDHVGSSMELTTITDTPSTNQDNYDPTGWNGTHPSRATVIKLTPSATILITGLVGGTNGRVAIIENDSTDYMIIIVPQSTSSTAANRFRHTGGNIPLFLMPGDTVMYFYDNTDSRWEIVTSSYGTGLTNQFDMADDFLATIGIYGTTVSGTGASGQTGTYLVNSTERPIGVFQIDTGTTATGRASIGSSSTNSIVPAQGAAFFLTRLAVEALSNGTERYQIFAGFHDAQAATNTTDGIYWSYRDDVSANWIRESAAASARTQNASSTAVDTNYIWLGIFINANWSRADYFLSQDSAAWSIIGSNSATMPSSTQLVSVAVQINKTVGTTQRNCSVDFMGWRYDFQRG